MHISNTLKTGWSLYFCLHYYIVGRWKNLLFRCFNLNFVKFIKCPVLWLCKSRGQEESSGDGSEMKYKFLKNIYDLKEYNWQEETLGRGPRPRVSRVSGMRARLGFYWVRGQGQESALVETRSGVFTWPGYRPLIGQEWSCDLDTGLSLVRSDHVTWILASHWSRVIPWSGY